MPSGTQNINLGGHVLPLQICLILNSLSFVVVVVVSAADVWFLFLFLQQNKVVQGLTALPLDVRFKSTCLYLCLVLHR